MPVFTGGAPRLQVCLRANKSHFFQMLFSANVLTSVFAIALLVFFM